MCQYIYFDENHVMAANQEQLNQIVPFERWKWNNHYIPEYEPKTCLCPINLKATLSKAGYKTKRLDSGDIKATRAPPHPIGKE